MTVADGRALVSEVWRLRAENETLRQGWDELKALALDLRSEVDDLVVRIDDERGKREEAVETAYQEGYKRGLATGKRGFGVAIGVDYRGDPSIVAGYVIRF